MTAGPAGGVRRVLVTRPEPEATRWVALLGDAGCRALALPLIVIGPAGEGARAEVRIAWHEIDRCAALMFVSAAAVRGFFEQKVPFPHAQQADDAINSVANRAFSAAESDLPALLRFWATGPGTVRALQVAGIPAASIDAPPHDAPTFDSEALWRIVGPRVRPGERVLLVRGGDSDDQPSGRDWLARQLAAAGAVCQELVAYRRVSPVFDAAQRDLAAAAARDGSIWLLTSAQAIANLCTWLPAIEWHGAVALVTHTRIAQAAQNAGFGRVVVTSPVLSEVVASIESLV